MTLEEFNTKYIYQYDKDKFGHIEVWEVITPAADGIYYGDCESYALTVQKYVVGYSTWDVYTCRTRGNGHAVLVSPNGKFILDNGKVVLPYDQFIKEREITKMKKVSPFFMWWHLAFGKFKAKHNSPLMIKLIGWI